MELFRVVIMLICFWFLIDSMASQKQSVTFDNYKVLLKRTSGDVVNNFTPKNHLQSQSSSGTISDEQNNVDIETILSSNKEESQLLFSLHEHMILQKDRLDDIFNRISVLTDRVLEIEKVMDILVKEVGILAGSVKQNESVINQFRNNETVITGNKDKKKPKKTKSNRHFATFSTQDLDMDLIFNTRERSESLSKEDQSSKKIKSIKRESKRN